MVGENDISVCTTCIDIRRLALGPNDSRSFQYPLFFYFLKTPTHPTTPTHQVDSPNILSRVELRFRRAASSTFSRSATRTASAGCALSSPRARGCCVCINHQTTCRIRWPRSEWPLCFPTCGSCCCCGSRSRGRDRPGQWASSAGRSRAHSPGQWGSSSGPPSLVSSTRLY